MKKTMIVLTAILLTLPCAMALATQDGTLPGQGTDSFTLIPADRDLIDAWNDDQPPGGATYSGSCFGFSYIPSQDYVLERIEWYAGNIGGTVTVELRDDGGGGEPNGTTLASVTYDEVPPRDWQGADLVPSVLIENGVQYWVVYSVVVGAQVSAATVGDIIPHWWGTDCLTWSGPWNSLPWMARFYGSQVTPVAEGTWSTVKALY